MKHKILFNGSKEKINRIYISTFPDILFFNTRHRSYPLHQEKLPDTADIQTQDHSY
jgi:hypothetical protein